MTNRSDLVRAIHEASTGREISQAVAALDSFDHAVTDRAAADRELDLGAKLASRRLDPVPVHEMHTAATDWLADFELPDEGGFRTAMVAEASTWYGRLDPAVRGDAEELAEQARGRARTAASAYGASARAAEQEFLQTVGYLSRNQGASGLPQIDQTIDPNNQPAATPYPTEVFPTFGEEQDQFNGVETNNHASGASTEGAPMLQQLQQQQNSGSGFGSGPEKPDEHDTAFDTSNSYAEVPLGAPGTLPTGAPGQGPSVPSTPNPIAGQPQVAGGPPAGDEDDQHRVAAVQGYSYPDAFGYRWVTTPEVHHPYHVVCASAHWPEEDCGVPAHTASVAIGYQMDLDKARQLAQAELLGAQEGLRAYHGSATLADLTVAHNRFTTAWGESGRSAEDTAVLHGFMAVVRPVLADMMPKHAFRSVTAQDFTGRPQGHVKGVPQSEISGYMREKEREFGQKAASLGSRLDFKTGAAGPRLGASGLDQVQQITDPDNQPSPQDDDLPEGVAFPLNEAYSAQWVTGPKGAQPTSEAAGQRGLPTEAARMFGHLDALDGRDPYHKNNYAFTSRAHGQYLRGWNTTHAMQAGLSGADPLTREKYGSMTGRPDLHADWQYFYDQARRRASTNQGHSQDDINVRESARRTAGDSGSGVHPDTSRCPSCGHLPGCDCTCPGQHGNPEAPHVPLRPRQADAWSQPRQSTDDLQPPYSQPATNMPMTQDQGDYEAGKAAGAADRASGERPAFADNSSTVSPYVKGYAESYSAASGPQGAQDVPYSLGGDSGQGASAAEAQQAFQVAHASRVSATFVPAGLHRHPDFAKAYRFTQIWEPGTPLTRTGSAAFEAGLYAGITDQPAKQAQWMAAHALHAVAYPELVRRIALHRSFTVKTEEKHRGLRAEGAYLVRKAGTTTDLISDGPGASPDPMGATPLNGPGTPPPMGGVDEAATPGGAPPYQGAPPLPGGPVVPDDVMGRPQRPPQPSGPFTNTFSGDHPENATLAPVAPDSAAQPGYSNSTAYQGDPRGGDRVAKLAAFRERVQASLAQRQAAPIHDEVRKHLKRAKSAFYAGERAHPHLTAKDLTELTHGAVSPRQLEGVLADLVGRGDARPGAGYGEWEASE